MPLYLKKLFLEEVVKLHWMAKMGRGIKKWLKTTALNKFENGMSVER